MWMAAIVLHLANGPPNGLNHISPKTKNPMKNCCYNHLLQLMFNKSKKTYIALIPNAQLSPAMQNSGTACAMSYWHIVFMIQKLDMCRG